MESGRRRVSLMGGRFSEFLRRQNWHFRLLALLLAVVVWAAVTGGDLGFWRSLLQGEAQAQVPVTLTFMGNPPDGWAMVRASVRPRLATVRGPEDAVHNAVAAQAVIVLDELLAGATRTRRGMVDVSRGAATPGSVGSPDEGAPGVAPGALLQLTVSAGLAAVDGAGTRLAGVTILPNPAEAVVELVRVGQQRPEAATGTSGG